MFIIYICINNNWCKNKSISKWENRIKFMFYGVNVRLHHRAWIKTRFYRDCSKTDLFFYFKLFSFSVVDQIHFDHSNMVKIWRWSILVNYLCLNTRYIFKFNILYYIIITLQMEALYYDETQWNKCNQCRSSIGKLV